MTHEEFRKQHPHLTFIGPESFPVIDPLAELQRQKFEMEKKERLKKYREICIQYGLKNGLQD